MMDYTQCPCAGINLDKLLQPTILSSLTEGELHGYGLVNKITGSSMFRGDKPDPTGVYRLLKGMEDRGLVTSRWDFKESEKPKRVYRITPQGVECLQRWVASLKGYTAAIEDLLIHAEAALSKSRNFGVNDRSDDSRTLSMTKAKT